MRPNNKLYETYAREHIIHALLDLMETFPYEQITILQITQEAEVSRRTFYLYYRTKLDTLSDYYEVLAKEYYACIKPNIQDDYRAQAELFFTFWKQHGHYLVLLDRNNLLYILLAKFEDYLMKMTDSEALDKNARYHSAFFAGGLWATLFAWIRDNFEETPSELAEVALQYQSISLFKSVHIRKD